MRQVKRKYLMVFCVLVALTACRKKIDHEPGVESAFDPFWTKVGNSYGLPAVAHAVEVFNGELYVGGVGANISGTNTYRCLSKIDANGVVTEVLNPGLSESYSGSNVSATVYDLQVFENELYVGGAFKFGVQGQFDYSFFKLDVNNTPISMGFTSATWAVKSFFLMNNSLMIFGSIAGSVQQYSNGTLSQFADVPWFNARGAGVAGNEIVLVRNNSTMARATASSTWTSYNMNLTTSSVYLYSFAKFGDAEYFTAEYSRVIKHDLITDDWSYMVMPNTYSSSSSGFFPQLKELDGELYVLARGIHKLNNNQWERVGAFTADVWDITNYNGRMYAGTQAGLFVSPE